VTVKSSLSVGRCAFAFALLIYPPHLRNAATLPWETLIVILGMTVHQHTARQTIKLLQRETPKFILPDFWPPNSPDLSRVDC